MKTLADIIAIESDIEPAIRDFLGSELFPDLFCDAVGKIDPARLYADQHGIFQVEMIFKYLVG